MNLTGERLYAAVHTQCAEIALEVCESRQMLNLVISAYGMLIENDCQLLANMLARQEHTAHGQIRAHEREMQTLRYETHRAENSAEVNECIAQVRRDITSATACGPNFVHCLDITGRF
jgi:hypothetical protein